MSKLLNKKFLSFLAVGLVFMAIGGAAALTVNNLTPMKISLFSQTISGSDLSATTQSVTVKQKSVTIVLTITNSGAAQHSGNVTVTCYDASLDELSSKTNVITNLGTGASTTSTFTFTQATDGVDRSTYNSHDIQIVQTA